MKILDVGQAHSISELIIEALDDNGYQTREESIPGLVQAIVDLATEGDDPTQLLDEAADLLADGGVTEVDG